MKITRLWLAASCALILPSLAYGQERPAAQSAGEHSGGTVGIIVTARRIEGRLQDVPPAISALSDQALEQKSVCSMADLSGAIPEILCSGAKLRVPWFQHLVHG